jgi:hypothetical protein
MIPTPNRLWNISKVCVMLVEESPLRSHQQPTILETMSMLIDVSRIDVFKTQNKINLSRTNVLKVDIEESKEYNQGI